MVTVGKKDSNLKKTKKTAAKCSRFIPNSVEPYLKPFSRSNKSVFQVGT
jgi:hypothetical protein